MDFEDFVAGFEYDFDDGFSSTRRMKDIAPGRPQKRKEIETKIEAELEKEYEREGKKQAERIQALEAEKKEWTEKVWEAETTEEVRRIKRRKYEAEEKKVVELEKDVAELKKKEAALLKRQ